MPTDRPPTAIHDAAWNAVAVASVAHREALDNADREQTTFARTLAAASTYGLTIDDLCAASGLDQTYVTDLLQQAATGSAGR